MRYSHLARVRRTVVNGLVETFTPAVRNELRLAGSEFFYPPGAAIPTAELDGSYVFVVDRGIASKAMRSDAGIISEVGLIGAEGMFPIGALLRVPSACRTMVSQVGDLVGRRIRAREFNSIVDDGPRSARETIVRFAYSFLTQVSCNIMSSDQDSVRKRLARWLLMCHDRIEGDTITITHDMLAMMISAQRPTTSNALQEMKREGLVELLRGATRILDRDGLFRIADGSYGLAEAYYRDQIAPFGKAVAPREDDPLIGFA
ncbi:Crp/Fnr family transcriptional regulator [Sphingomonas sp. ASV193]|uniref:Crp/Fnr family transcriptional regulator n=1 Tax=Sphingomonas sp. ASV193 TaxID=3144405 RepID=UPI0032E87A42